MATVAGSSISTYTRFYPVRIYYARTVYISMCVCVRANVKSDFLGARAGTRPAGLTVLGSPLARTNYTRISGTPRLARRERGRLFTFGQAGDLRLRTLFRANCACNICRHRCPAPYGTRVRPRVRITPERVISLFNWFPFSG